MSETNLEFKDEDSKISFIIDEAEPPEIMRIEADGKIYVHDREVTTDIEVYNGLVEFLKRADCYE